jgi:hypothetical protein
MYPQAEPYEGEEDMALGFETSCRIDGVDAI